jgi:hypothetical protein
MNENFDGCQLEKSGTLTDEDIDQRNDYELSDLSPEEQVMHTELEESILFTILLYFS